MRNYELNRKLRFFLLTMIVFPFIVLFCIVIAPDLINPPKPGENYLRDKIKINCQGRVFKIYRQRMNHNIQTLKTESCLFQLPSNWEDKFQVNDSISKKEGELFVEHYRDGKLLEVLDYHDIAKDLK